MERENEAIESKLGVKYMIVYYYPSKSLQKSSDTDNTRNAEWNPEPYLLYPFVTALEAGFLVSGVGNTTSLPKVVELILIHM